MPSKQFRAYDWALSVAFPKLVGKDILPFNNLFTSDQEMALAVSIRKLLGDGGGEMIKVLNVKELTIQNITLICIISLSRNGKTT